MNNHIVPIIRRCSIWNMDFYTIKEYGKPLRNLDNPKGKPRNSKDLNIKVTFIE